jgi:large subunit ribosomal protein L20
MARVKGGTMTKKRHKKILKMSKGYVGRSNNCFIPANQKIEKGLQYAYRDRRNKKRTFRNLWVARVNAAARLNGMVYSDLINGLKLANIAVDRKILAQLAIESPESFTAIAEQAKSALAQNKVALKGTKKAA